MQALESAWSVCIQCHDSSKLAGGGVVNGATSVLHGCCMCWPGWLPVWSCLRAVGAAVRPTRTTAARLPTWACGSHGMYGSRMANGLLLGRRHSRLASLLAFSLLLAVSTI